MHTYCVITNKKGVLFRVITAANASATFARLIKRNVVKGAGQ